jgi:type III secretory pathway component EscR
MCAMFLKITLYGATQRNAKNIQKLPKNMEVQKIAIFPYFI